MTAYDESMGSGNPVKFIIGGMLILVAIVFIVATSMFGDSAQLDVTNDEILAKGNEAVGLPMRIHGAVLGDTIRIEDDVLKFTIAHVPEDYDSGDGLAAVLHEAVTDPLRQKLEIVHDGPWPDLLQDEALAIVVGRLGEDGIFVADELLLKCPTRYEEARPEQADS